MLSILGEGRHVPVLIGLQIAFIIIFGIFADYDEVADSGAAAGKHDKNENNDIQHYYPKGVKTATALVLLQMAMACLFAGFVDYEDQANASNVKHSVEPALGGFGREKQKLMRFYPMFQDVHVMMFIGFGFLMTFLKRYSYSAVALNFLIAAIVLQWATLCQGFFHSFKTGTLLINIENLLNADFASATVLISFGAVLGVTTPLQLITMALIETALFATNEWIGLDLFEAVDVGGSMFVHVFGAYFGLMVSMGLKRDVSSAKEGPVYHSDVFAMIGTIFLWLFWPSFNSGLAEGDAQHRAVINTYYSLAACCVTAFAFSSLLSKEHKFDMVHIQNSTLAGGVAIGTAADMMIHPFGAMIVGSIAGAVSVMGYRFITPFLNKRLGLHDTCGVHNLHGMPGVIAAIVGGIVAACATQEDYSYNLYRQFPARAPHANTSEFIEIFSHNTGIKPGHDRSAMEQGSYQIAALAVTLAIALTGGLVTGLILRLPVFGKVSREHLFDDEHSWEVPEPEETHGNGLSNNSHTVGHLSTPGPHQHSYNVHQRDSKM